MLIGYLVSGLLGGLFAATSCLALGHPAVLVILAYSLFGVLGMVGFGLVAEGHASQG